MAEVYAFARTEPLDLPLQRMFAQLTAVLAKVNGNDVTDDQFMLTPPPVVDDRALRTQQIADMFAKAAKANSVTH